MTIDFNGFDLTGIDSEKFLQGQLTCDTKKLGSTYTPTAICNLKGRVQFGLWAARTDAGFSLVVSADLAQALVAHIKKYGAFSKIQLSQPQLIYPTLTAGLPDFSPTAKASDWQAWATKSIETGNYWINATNSELFQPQELRLHQRGGVDYDKGCYLGQEVVARLWFKASPKAWLHRIALDKGEDLCEKIQLVNRHENEALVVARPETLTGLTVLALPDGLNDGVAR